MNKEQLIQKNISNLTNLFKQMGVINLKTNINENIYASKSWPNRFWIDYKYTKEQTLNLLEEESLQKANYIVPLWQDEKELIDVFEKAGYEVLFEQIGMYLDLEKYQEEKNTVLNIESISSKEDILLWTQIASDSFGYIIDENIIEKLNENDEITLLLAYFENKAVGTALLFENSEVIGIHLVGVPKENRKKGYAKSIMQEAINLAKTKKYEYMTLQASALGLGIYKKLGFKEHFLQRNFYKKQS